MPLASDRVLLVEGRDDREVVYQSGISQVAARAIRVGLSDSTMPDARSSTWLATSAEHREWLDERARALRGWPWLAALAMGTLWSALAVRTRSLVPVVTSHLAWDLLMMFVRPL